MISKRLRCAVALAALSLASCGGGSSSAPGALPPMAGGGGGTPTPTPTPTPSPTPTSAPRFSFAAPFAFETTIGVEGTLFTFENTFPQVLRTDLIDPRFFSPDRAAQVSFALQGGSEAISFRYDNINISATGTGGSNPEFRVVEPGGEAERLVLGPLTPRFVSQQNGSAEVTVVSYRSPRVARTFDTRMGTAQRQIFAIIGNPAVEFGPIARSKEYQISGDFTGDLSIGGSFMLSSDSNTGIFGVPRLVRSGPDGRPNLEVNLFPEGAHNSVNNRISGRIRDRQGGNVIGTFEGALYGPSRNHVGMVFDITLPETGQRHIGYAFGFGQDRS